MVLICLLEPTCVANQYHHRLIKTVNPTRLCGAEFLPILGGIFIVQKLVALRKASEVA